MRTKLYWPSVKAMVFGLGLCLAVSAITPTTSHAIPVAGDYTFTSGLTGTFTSDGTKLTTWVITDPFLTTWTPPAGGIVSNNATLFDQAISNLLGIAISWDSNSFSSTKLNRTPISGVLSYSSPNSVPEPSGLALVSLGLGLLALYGWRQRRQAGVQIG